MSKCGSIKTRNHNFVIHYENVCLHCLGKGCVFCGMNTAKFISVNIYYCSKCNLRACANYMGIKSRKTNKWEILIYNPNLSCEEYLLYSILE